MRHRGRGLAIQPCMPWLRKRSRQCFKPMASWRDCSTILQCFYHRIFPLFLLSLLLLLLFMWPLSHSQVYLSSFPNPFSWHIFVFHSLLFSFIVQGAIFQAMYDYDAQDDDEVSFVENDLVINCDPIDEGWMFGTIKRTGRRGMLPANYVERVQ